jgi:uncharacterized protein YbjQ (UPF0145 family)
MDDDLIGVIWIIVSLTFSAGPILFSWLYGNYYQKEKVNQLVMRESAFLTQHGRDNIHSISNLIPPKPIANCGLVMANISVGTSWWQTMIGRLHTIFGGNITMFDRVLNYGRREALQRLREQALQQGWDNVINVRLETARIVSSNNSDKGSAYEILAYGTGIKHQ